MFVFDTLDGLILIQCARCFCKALIADPSLGLPSKAPRMALLKSVALKEIHRPVIRGIMD
jgi:hypothetical protein